MFYFWIGGNLGALQADGDGYCLGADLLVCDKGCLHNCVWLIGEITVRRCPYLIMVFAAMLPWQFFANALAECSNSLIGIADLMAKVYFLRLIVPAMTSARAILGGKVNP